MKNVLLVKVVAVVLALSFAFPRPALAAGEFAPFDDLVGDLVDAIDQVVAEIDTAVAEFGADSKISKFLNKGKDALGQAKDILVNDEFPKNVKKAAGKIKRWSKFMDKAAKAGSVKVPVGKVNKYEREIDPSLASHLNAWSVLIIVAVVAIVSTALSLSLSWYGDFTKGLEKKHIKTDAKMVAAFLLWGMIGGSFLPGSFYWQLGATKKGYGQLFGALKLSVILMLFIASFQSQ